MVPQFLFERTFDVLPFGVYVVDVKSFEVVYVNQAMASRQQVAVGDRCWESIYHNDRQCQFCKIPDLVGSDGLPNGKVIVFENFQESFDEWHQVQEQAISWPDGRIVKYSIAVNISQVKEGQNRLAEAHAELALAYRELEKTTTIDALTGLSIRPKLDEVFAHEIEQAEHYGQPLSVILTDVNKLKSINDTHGHQVGDKVLREVADIIRAVARNTDVVGRWNGQEIMVLCPKTELDAAFLMAARMRRIIAEFNFTTVGRKTSSFGVAGYRLGDQAHSIVKRAYDALYRAKQNGRNWVELEEPE